MSLALINGRQSEMLSSRNQPVADTQHVISERLNRWIVPLAETTDWVIDTACGCICHSIYIWLLSVAHIHSGFGMIVWALGFGIGVCRFSRPLRRMDVLAMPSAGLNTMGHFKFVCEGPPGAEWLGVAVGVLIEGRCIVDRVDGTCWVISATWALFSQHDGVEMFPCIVEAMELLCWEESFSAPGTDRLLLAGRTSIFSGGLCYCWHWPVARAEIFWTTGVMSGSQLWVGRVQYRRSTPKMLI
jgi:hypothetical protein